MQLAGPAAGDKRLLQEPDRRVACRPRSASTSASALPRRDRRAGVGVARLPSRGCCVKPRRAAARSPAPWPPAPDSRIAAPIARGSSSAVPTSRARTASESASARSPERTATSAPLDEDRPGSPGRPPALVARRAGRSRRRGGCAAVAVSPRRAWTRPRRSSIAGRPASCVTAAAASSAATAPGVVAQHGAQLTDRRLEAGDVRVPEGERRSEVIERLAVRVHRPRPGTRVARRPRRPRRRGQRRARGRRSGRAAPGRRVRPGPHAGPRRRAGGAGAARARLVASYAASRSRACPKSKAVARPPPPTSRTRPRRTSSSRAVIVSSSERPLAARTVARSNERPITAPAASSWPAVSATAPRRSRSRARTPRGGPSPRLPDRRRGPRRRTAGAPRTLRPAPAPRTPACPGSPRPPPGGRRRPARAGPARRASTSGTRSTAAANASPRSSRSSGSPRQHDQHGPIPETPDEEQEGLARRVVSPLQVLDDDQARSVAGDQRHQHGRDGVQEPRPGRRLVVDPGVPRPGREVADGLRRQGDEPLDLPQRRRRQPGQCGRGAREREAGAQQLHDRGVGDRALGREGSSREHAAARSPRRNSAIASASRDLPIPASPTSTPTRPRGVAARWAREERRQLGGAPHEWQAGGSHAAGSATSATPAAAHGIDARWLGAARHRLGIPDGLVEVRRLGQRRDAELAFEDGDPARYWRMAPARSPALARMAISWRRAGSSSGSRSSRRDAAAIAAGRCRPVGLGRIASRSSTSTTSRSTATARVARQSSKSGLSRSENPARNGPRASGAARRRPAVVARREPPPRAPRDRRAPSLAIEAHGRSARRMTHRPPSAERRTESVRRRALARRLVVRLRPQHARPARRGRYGRPSTPRRARIATALRVSTTSGTPSTRMSRVRGRGPPARGRGRPGMDIGPMMRNGIASHWIP